MTKSKYLILFFLLTQNLFAAPIKISSFIGVELAGDVGQYQQTVAKNRDQTRKAYLNELVEAVLKISQGSYYPELFLDTLSDVQRLANGKRDNDLRIDEVGIGVSAGEIFKLEFEKNYQEKGVNLSERKVEFVRELPSLSSDRKISAIPFNHYVQLTVIHVGQGEFKVSGTLGKISSKGEGIERSFTGEGSLVEALTLSARSMFLAIHQIEYPRWETPLSNLTWIKAPQKAVTTSEAQLFCRGQKARLPYAEELILAEQGAGLREGSIESFKKFDSYHVADLRFQKTNLSLYVGDELKLIGTSVSAKVWCVRGDISPRQVLINKLFSYRRVFDPKGYSSLFFKDLIVRENLRKVLAIESVLIDLNAFDMSFNSQISSLDYIEPAESHLLIEGFFKDFSAYMR